MKQFEINKVISDRIKEGRLIEKKYFNDTIRIFVVEINKDKVDFDLEIYNKQITLNYTISKIYPLKDLSQIKEKSFTKLIKNKVTFLNNHFKKKYPNPIDKISLKKIKKEFGNVLIFKDNTKTIIINNYSFKGNEKDINLSRYSDQENPNGDGMHYSPDPKDYDYDKYFVKGKELSGGIKISYYENNDFILNLDNLYKRRIIREKKLKQKSVNKIQPNINEF